MEALQNIQSIITYSFEYPFIVDSISQVAPK